MLPIVSTARQVLQEVEVSQVDEKSMREIKRAGLAKQGDRRTLQRCRRAIMR